MPLTSKFAARVAEIFPDAPVIAGNKIAHGNAQYHLGRARILIGFLADAVAAESAELDDKTAPAAVETWEGVAGEAEMLLEEAWRFDRAFRELLAPGPVMIMERARDEGWLVTPVRDSEAAERLAAVSNLQSPIDRRAPGTTPAPAASAGETIDEPEDASTEFVAEIK